MNALSISSPTDSCVRNKRGFTLVEILVAMFVFAILASTLFGSFNFLFKNVDALKDAGVVHDMASRCLLRFIVDLESAQVTPRAFYTVSDSIGESDPFRIVGGVGIPGSDGEPGLRFSSRAHLPFYGHSEEDSAEIVYYFDREDDGSGVLRRADRVFAEEPFEASEKDPVVCESVESVSFAFFDGEGNRFDHWDSDSVSFDYSTPTSVEIRLGVSGKSGIFEFGTRTAIPVVREKKK